MTSCVRVLSTQTLDSFPSILLVAPNGKKTLVNCGEGCQRIFLEFGQKVSTIDRVCLTHLGHETIGGLPGMILTASDVVKQATDHAKAAATKTVASSRNQKQNQHLKKKVKQENNKKGPSSSSPLIQPGLKLIGPNGTYKFFRSLRHFMRRDSFWIDVREGVYSQGESNCDAANSNAGSNTNGHENKKKTEMGKKSRNNDLHTDDNSFLIQSIATYVRTNANIDADTDVTTASSTQFNSECTTDSAIFPSKKRPRTTDEGENGTTTTTTTTTTKGTTTTPQQSSHHHENEQSHNHSRQILSFLFTTPPIQGRFLVEKAKALGVPRGPLYAQLKSGKTVTFPVSSSFPPESTTVTVESHQVVEPGSPGVVVAVLCYPSLDVLDQLQNSKELRLQRRAEENETAAAVAANNNKNDQKPMLELIVHMTTLDIFNSDACATWRKSFFQQSVRHLFVRTGTTTTSIDREVATPSLSPFQSAHSGAHLRSRVCSDVYRVPIPEDVKNENAMATTTCEEQRLLDIESEEAKDDASSSVVHAVPLLEYVLLPRSKRGFCNEHLFIQKWKEMEHDAQILLDTSGCLDRAKQILDECNFSPCTTTIDKDASSHSSIGGEILFTGTGSAVPCKHRNVSGIYVRMNNGNSMLLDVGEGTIGQLLRAKQHQKYRGKGEESLATVLKNIKAVWISHPHADHHLGILRLLEERKRLVSDRDPLVLIAPPNILSFLQEYELVEPQVAGSYIFLDCRALLANYDSNNSGETNPNHVALQRLQQDLGIESCTAIPVAHCPHSFAVVFHRTSFGSLAYSGDCRPSKNFAKIAYNADLLIHEATFADGMEADAVVKRHCTVGEALHVAKEMNAKTTILTHFSQRYPKIPLLRTPDNAANTISTSGTMDTASSPSSLSDMKVIHAFDFMTITASNITAASMLTPALQLLYPDGSEDAIDDDTTEKSDAQAALEVPGLFAQSELL